MTGARLRAAALGVWALGIWLLVAACSAAPAGQGPVPTHTVAAAATFVRPVKAEGTLEAVESTPLAAPADSERPMKIAWVADDGARVRAGDVIVRFDDTEAIRLKADSTDDVRSAQRKINKVTVQSGAARHKRQGTAGLAELETEVARGFVADDIEIFSRNEIIESTIDIDLAEAKFGHSRNLERIERSVASHEMQLHRIDKGRATREVERADGALTRLEVKAPHDGIVVLKRNWRGETTRVGDTVWRGQTIAELPHVESLQAALFVLEADAGSLVEGLAATLTIEAHPEVGHAAKVLRVDTLAKPRHHEVPVHYFGVVLALTQTDAKTMRIGQRVTAVINIERPDALVVPRQAVFEVDGKTVVYVRDDDVGFSAVPVVVGLSSAGRVVVTEGVAAGDEVALRDPTVVDAGLPLGGKSPWSPGGGGSGQSNPGSRD